MYYDVLINLDGFVGVVVLKLKLKIYLNVKAAELDDPMKKARDVKEVRHYSHDHDTEVTINNSSVPANVINICS